MRIVARRGDNVYLLHVKKRVGRVLDLDQKILFPPFNIDSILARGYWEEYTGSQEILPSLLKMVSIREAGEDK